MTTSQPLDFSARRRNDAGLIFFHSSPLTLLFSPFILHNSFLALRERFYFAVNPDTEEFATEFKLDKGYVDIKSLIIYVINDIKDASLITYELPVIAGIDVPKGKGI